MRLILPFKQNKLHIPILLCLQALVGTDQGLQVQVQGLNNCYKEKNNIKPNIQKIRETAGNKQPILRQRNQNQIYKIHGTKRN
jgi:hypothetical protein